MSSVRHAANELIYNWLVVHACREPREVPPRHYRAIEQASKMVGLLAQSNGRVRQELSMGRRAGGESAAVGEGHRSRIRGGKRAGLVNGSEFFRIALDPASHDRGIVINIGKRTPRNARPFPGRVQEDAPRL